jgi:hypothetical protein
MFGRAGMFAGNASARIAKSLGFVVGILQRLLELVFIAAKRWQEPAKYRKVVRLGGGGDLQTVLFESAVARDGSGAVYVPLPETLAALPPAIDLRAVGFPPVHAQGALNSCTAHVLAALIHYDMVRRCPGEAFEPSRLFIYYNQREFRRDTGTAHRRCGAPVRMDDGIGSIRASGFCREAEWPYVEALFDVRPAAPLYEIAARQRSHDYSRVTPDIAHLKACLAEGYPFACGIAMYASFLGPAMRRSGIVSLPKTGEVLRGGHAVAVVGYDDARGHFIARNSFGPDWGDAGHCYLPYEFLGDPRYGFDFWIVGAASGSGDRKNSVADIEKADGG